MLDLLTKEIVKTKSFAFAPATASPLTVELLEAGEVSENAKPFFDRWVPEYAKSTLQLLLYREDALVATLTLTARGIFEGRDRASKGYVELAPLMSLDRKWQAMSNPARFQKEIADQVADRPRSFTYKESLSVQFDWKKYEYNLGTLLKDDGGVKDQTAIAIIGCDRPTYFEQTVRSIAANSKVRSMPVFVFLDQAARDHKPENWDKQVAVVKEVMPHAVIIKRPRNFGCGRNIIDARLQLFGNLKYEQAFIFEDDLVISPDYIDLCLNLMAYADENFSNVGAVQAWDKCIMSSEHKLPRIGEIHATYSNWWGYLMKRSAWDSISSAILEYQDMFLSGLYSDRPHRSIWAYFDDVRRHAPAGSGDRPYRLDAESAAARDRYMDQPPTGQDAATMIFYEQAGLVRLATSVNRGRYIGMQGIHMNPRSFERDGFPRVELGTYPDDSKRLEFWPRGSRPVESPDSSSEIKGIGKLDA